MFRLEMMCPMCFCCPCSQVNIWMQGILLTISFTVVALIMHTDMLLLDSDLLFQKAGGNVQHTLLTEWWSCIHEMSRDDSLFFFLILFWMCNVYFRRTHLKTAWGWEPNKKFSFLSSCGLFLPEARWSTSKAKGILCQHLKLTATDPPKE